MPRLLVVEDSPTQAEELRLILEAHGFTVETAPDAEMGLKCLAASPYDLLLTDILLPGLSGYELCRRVKSDPHTRGTPVVLLTVLNDPLDILQGLECGADNFLTKPYDPNYLVLRLRDVIANRGRRTEPTDTAVLSFRGRGVTVTTDKGQIMDLLLSALDEFVRSKEREHEARVAQDALEKSLRFVQAALDALSTHVAILDEAGTVLAVNAAWRGSQEGNPLAGSGCGVGANYPQVCESAAGVDQAGPIGQGVRGVAGGRGEGYSLEYSFVGPQGRRWFLVHVSHFRATGPMRVVVAHEDVSDCKKLEEWLRQRNEELADSDRRKTEFLGMLAHELRNPMAPLLSGLHIARQPGVSESAREQALDTAERQARHLQRLVNDLLEGSRVTRGKVQLQTERLDLARLVRAACEDCRAALEAAGLTLALALPETPIWVNGDATRLTQVVSSLLDNAVRFTDRGGVTVQLSVDDDSGRAVLTVRDTGIGMEPEMIGRLFEPFSQAERSLHRSRGGLGLGLAVAKGLLELHAGDIRAASAGPERGAEFTVRLPVQPEPAALSAPPGEPRPACRKLRVLLVEDNRDAADSLRLLLSAVGGHEVEMSHTGPEGVEKAGVWRPDVVLSDIGLPGLDGFGVARALRSNPATARARLVAITGYGSDADRERAREAGFDHVLVKPADPADILQMLEAAR